MRKLTIILIILLAAVVFYWAYKNSKHRVVPPASTALMQPAHIKPLPNINPPDNCPPYERKEQYGKWIDEDGDCKETRAEILEKYNTGEFVMNKNCKVVSGLWYDPYSNQEFNDAKELDIDHIVPLKNAHINGACLWNHDKQVAFANDADNLIPVYESLNKEKGDKPINVWIPPNPVFICQYAEKWSDIKNKYQLASSESERATIQKYIETCPKK